MLTSFEVRRTYKYRLYRSDRVKHLVNAIDIAGIVWNHGLALSRRYYRRYGKGLSFNRLQKHIARLRSKT
ncbi:MAG: helix-turn-helix domain-containing protein, partial [Chloroflexota bacterium]